MFANKKTVIIRIFQGGILILGILNVFYIISYRHFDNYNFFIGFILIFLSSWFIIVVHELGHVFFLVWNKMPIRSVYIPFLSIHLGERKKCKISTVRINEGLVIPEFPIVYTELEFIQLKKTYSRFLLAGPIASIIFCCAIILGLLNMQYFFKEIASYCGIILLNMCIQTFFLIQNCFKESVNSIGDIVAIDKVSKNNFFFASYVYCCYFFSEDYKIKITESIYVKSVIKDRLIIMSDDELVRESDLLDEIIYRTICAVDDYFGDFLDQRIHKLLSILRDQGQWEGNVVSTYLHALMYIIIVCNERNEALHLYIQTEDFLQQQHNRNCEYLLSQIRYLLYLEPNKPKEIYPIPEFERWSFYRQYYDCENVIMATNEYSV